MPTLYKYICYPCRDSELTISDDEDDEYGAISEFRNMEDRDVEFLCPQCDRPLVRVVIPDSFVTTWGNIYNAKKTSLGPSKNEYPPKLARDRKARNPPVSFGWTPPATKTPKPGVI